MGRVWDTGKGWELGLVGLDGTWYRGAKGFGVSGIPTLGKASGIIKSNPQGLNAFPAGNQGSQKTGQDFPAPAREQGRYGNWGIPGFSPLPQS